MRRIALLLPLAACGSPTPAADPDAAAPAPDAAFHADWELSVGSAAGRMEPALLGFYDLSGDLLDYSHRPHLVDRMKAIGFSDWRVGLGRWEVATRLLPALTDSTSCGTFPGFPTDLLAPQGSTAASLAASRDWFTDTGTPATLADTANDARYSLDYLRGVLDQADAFGATPYVDIDHMPLALSASRTYASAHDGEGVEPCFATWTNQVSNVRPADPQIFASAVVGVVRRIVEGDATHAPRRAPRWEIWNEPELSYAWDTAFEQPPSSLNAYFATAITTLVALANYRTTSGQDLQLGLGSFAIASTAATVLTSLDANALPDGSHAPIDFISFHSYNNDPLAIVADIQAVATARAATTHYRDAELVLAEWGPDLIDAPPASDIDTALLVSTVIARGAALGLGRTHKTMFYDFAGGLPYPALDHDGNPRPLYHAYELLHALVGDGADRLASDSELDDGAGAVVVARTSDGTIRALLVNRGDSARTAHFSGAPTPTHVQLLRDTDIQDVTPSAVVDVPAHSIVLVTM